MKKIWMGVLLAIWIAGAAPALAAGLEEINGAYQIGSAADFRMFADLVNQGAYTANAVLTADIDLADQAWTPIGSKYADSYQGFFDGQGFSVRGLSVSGKTNQGLFGYVSTGTVKNIRVYGRIEASGNYAGGIAAVLNGGLIENCANYAEITGQGSTGCVGGIVGEHVKGTVRRCCNLGQITGTGCTAGISGRVKPSAGTAQISSCYNGGTILGNMSNVGGIAGYVKGAQTSLKNCYNYGAVKNTAGAFTGGVIGNFYSGACENCFYLEGTWDFGLGAYAPEDQTDGSTTRMPAADMQSAEFAAQLGGEFVPDAEKQNGGFPLLAWQCESGNAVEISYEQGTIRVKAPQGMEAAVYAAVVRGNTVVDVYKAQLAGTETEIADTVLQLERADTLQIFVWHADMKPACPAARFRLTE